MITDWKTDFIEKKKKKKKKERKKKTLAEREEFRGKIRDERKFIWKFIYKARTFLKILLQILFIRKNSHLKFENARDIRRYYKKKKKRKKKKTLMLITIDNRKTFNILILDLSVSLSLSR